MPQSILTPEAKTHPGGPTQAAAPLAHQLLESSVPTPVHSSLSRDDGVIYLVLERVSVPCGTPDFPTLKPASLPLPQITKWAQELCPHPSTQ